MDKENLNISFIGVGRMGEALIKGLLRSGSDASKITAYDTDAKKLKDLASTTGIQVAASSADAAGRAGIVIIAVKPAIVTLVLKEIRETVNDGTLVISIAAGVNLKTLAAVLKPGAKIIRVMPNGPAEKGAGMAAIAGGEHASEEDIARASEVFGAVGLAAVIDENLMNAATAVSGSGPAYFYLFVKALADAGARAGLPAETAYRLAHETMFGASRMLKYSKKPPEELIEGVRSPGGTTDAALRVMEERGLESIIGEAVAAAAARGNELEEEAERTATGD